jgi:tetratricopeptide (TPR) repeat protein
MSIRSLVSFVICAALLALPAAADEVDDLGKPEKAIEKFSKAVEKAPEDSESWYNLGLAYYKAKKNDDAAKAMAKSVEINGKNANAHAWLGVMYLALDKGADAVKEFEAALAIDPTLTAARGNLAQAYYTAGRWDDAIAAYKELAKAKPENVDAVYTQLGNAYLKKGDVEQAIRWFEKTVEADPNDATGQYNLAVTYRKVAAESSGDAAKQMWERCADQFVKASALAPNDLKLLVYTGEALAFAGRKPDALSTFDRYLKADPDGKKAGLKAHQLALDYKTELSK